MICAECKKVEAPAKHKYCYACGKKVKRRQNNAQAAKYYAGVNKIPKLQERPKCCGITMENHGLFLGCSICDKVVKI